MKQYEIHPVEGDTPYATIHGDFSMDDLLVILNEMRELYDSPPRTPPEPPIVPTLALR